MCVGVPIFGPSRSPGWTPFQLPSPLPFLSGPPKVLVGCLHSSGVLLLIWDPPTSAPFGRGCTTQQACTRAAPPHHLQGYRDLEVQFDTDQIQLSLLMESEEEVAALIEKAETEGTEILEDEFAEFAALLKDAMRSYTEVLSRMAPLPSDRQHCKPCK